LVLDAGCIAAPAAPAEDRPKDEPAQKGDADPNAKKAEARAAKELQDLQAIFPPGKPVTIFSKDYGPVEGVVLLKLLEFRGVGFFHLQRQKDGKHLLLRCENITLIRED
jgi:hypothetical protein